MGEGNEKDELLPHGERPVLKNPHRETSAGCVPERFEAERLSSGVDACNQVSWAASFIASASSSDFGVGSLTSGARSSLWFHVIGAVGNDSAASSRSSIISH